MKKITCAVAKDTVTIVVCFTGAHKSRFTVVCTEGVGIAIMGSLCACSERISYNDVSRDGSIWSHFVESLLFHPVCVFEQVTTEISVGSSIHLQTGMSTYQVRHYRP